MKVDLESLRTRNPERRNYLSTNDRPLKGRSGVTNPVEKRNQFINLQQKYFQAQQTGSASLTKNPSNPHISPRLAAKVGQPVTDHSQPSQSYGVDLEEVTRVQDFTRNHH